MSDNVELEESIQKWRDIVAGKVGDKGLINCSLCQKYINRNCIGCVVWQDTNQPACYDTPYRGWFVHHRKEHTKERRPYKGRRIECPTCLELAQKELDYLKSLR